MKVKTLVQQLRKLNQNATVVVQEYNGAQDIPRPIICVREISAQYINSQRMGQARLKGKFVLLSGFNLGTEDDDLFH